MQLHRAVVLLFLGILPMLVAAQDYYEILGLEKRDDLTERQLKRAYREMSKKYHPDKNPDDDEAEEKFRKVAEAYEALADPELRKIYDRYGAEGLKQHQQGGGQATHHDPFDLFSRFFGGGGHFGHAGGVRRGPNMEVKIALPLRDFYTGASREFSVRKQQICDECEGTGSRDGHTERCHECAGRGIKLQKHMLAPGIFQQVQTQCARCGGRGEIISHPCPVCGGSKVVEKVATHTLVVEPGTADGARVAFENEADESPDWVAGDLHVLVEEAPPPADYDAAVQAAAAAGEDAPEHAAPPADGTWFRRKGPDLYWREVLSLREALLGAWTRNLTHLDGHVVTLGRAKGETVQPGFVERIEGEGMPLALRDDDRERRHGRLLVEYTVVLPDLMESGMRKELWQVFEKWRKKAGQPLMPRGDGARDEL